MRLLLSLIILLLSACTSVSITERKQLIILGDDVIYPQAFKAYDEFKKKNPDVYFFSINASKQKDHEFIDIYNLNNTPTYVLINNQGEKLGRRVGTFYPKYFENKIG